jgi:hypothetical protein
MALGERFRSGGTRGIARFLADHQHCDAGFDVRRENEPGSGRLKITCLGCGQEITYKAAEAGELAGIGLPAVNGEAAAAVEEPRPPQPPQPTPPRAEPGRERVPGPPRRDRAAATVRGFPPPRPSRRASPRIPSWIPLILIGALIAGGVGMIILGLTREDEQPQAPAGTAAEAPAEQTPPSDEAAEEPAPAEPAAPPAGDQPDAAPADVELTQRTFARRFEIGVPAGWEDGVADGAVSLSAPGDTAEIRVFFEKGERPTGELAGAASSFLQGEHSGAEISAPRQIRVAGRRAARVRATYGGGEEIAIVLSARGFAYLITERVDRGASPQVEAEADAALQSFRPR